MVVVVDRCVLGQEANRGLMIQLFENDMSFGVWRQIPCFLMKYLCIVFAVICGVTGSSVVFSSCAVCRTVGLASGAVIVRVDSC